MNTPFTPEQCPECSNPLTGECPGGLCPACLMRQAMMPTAATSAADAEPHAGRGAEKGPSLAEVTVAFPHLEVLERIGQGGMGVVFKVRQPRLNRMAALKLIPAERAGRDPAFAGRFEREGELLARLHHPNIISVHDSGKVEGFYYLLMEYADGVNLRQAMRAGCFTPEQALAVVPKICEALQYAHGEGVLHRDIKPENILLDHRGRVKLADFGIAKLLTRGDAEDGGPPEGGENPPPAGEDGLTCPGSAPGTPHYMAPEQISHPKDVDHRADIYSLGVVFYELLTGELPGAAFLPPSHRAEVDPRVDDIVRQALEKERARRQSSAGEMRTQVETLKEGGLHGPGIRDAGSWRTEGFEYRSRRTLWSLPLLHVVAGMDPVTKLPRHARGIFAFGETASGVVAIGGKAYGFLAFGGVAVGVISGGGMAAGLVSFGGLAVALGFAMGGLAAAPLAFGGLALGWTAVGGIAAGWHAAGGVVFGHLGVGGQVSATRVATLRDSLPWALRTLMRLTPWAGFSGLLLVPLVLISVLVPQWAMRKAAGSAGGRRGSGPDGSPPGGEQKLAASARGSRRKEGVERSVPPQKGVDRRPQGTGRTPVPSSGAMGGPPPRIWLWTGRVLLGCAAPFVLMGLIWLHLMSTETGGWNPAPAEALLVTLVWMAAVLLLGSGGFCLLLDARKNRPGGRASTAGLTAVLLAAAAALVPVIRLAVQPSGRSGPSRESGVTGSPGGGVSPGPSVHSAGVEQLRKIYGMVRQRYEAGLTGYLEVLDARFALDMAGAGDDPVRKLEARRQWASERLALLEQRHQSGIESSLEVEKARLERDRAEDDWQRAGRP